MEANDLSAISIPAYLALLALASLTFLAGTGYALYAFISSMIALERKVEKGATRKMRRDAARPMLKPMLTKAALGFSVSLCSALAIVTLVAVAHKSKAPSLSHGSVHVDAVPFGQIEEGVETNLANPTTRLFYFNQATSTRPGAVQYRLG